MKNTRKQIVTGECREEWKNRQDGFITEYGDDTTLNLYCFINHPTEAEVLAFSNGTFEIAYSPVPFGGMKFLYFTALYRNAEGSGGMLGECPYFAPLYRGTGVAPWLSTTNRITVTAMLIDSDEGRLVAVRNIPLPGDMSLDIANISNAAWEASGSRKVNAEAYRRFIDTMQTRQELQAVHKRAKVICKIEPAPEKEDAAEKAEQAQQELEPERD